MFMIIGHQNWSPKKCESSQLRYIAERWRMDYNHYRPHSSLCYMTPAEYAKLCEDVGCVKQRKQRNGQAELSETLSQRVD